MLLLRMHEEFPVADTKMQFGWMICGLSEISLHGPVDYLLHKRVLKMSLRRTALYNEVKVSRI